MPERPWCQYNKYKEGAYPVLAEMNVLFLEGIVHQLYPGNLLKPIFGFEVDDAAAVYQLTKRTALTFVFDEDGLGAGEQAYSAGPTTIDDVVKVAASEVPEAFHHNPLTAA